VIATENVMVYADTSFLFSLVLHDANTAGAVSYLRRHSTSLALTTWQRCELNNAVRLSVWRGNCSAAIATAALGKIEADLKAGNFTDTPLVWPDVLKIADELGEKQTSVLGVRTLDLLHVSAAISLKAKTFLTYDGRQLALARASGLRAQKL
jgi:predicted nucleic acid-binding protein